LVQNQFITAHYQCAAHIFPGLDYDHKRSYHFHKNTATN
jgi:hypothetical protein